MEKVSLAPPRSIEFNLGFQLNGFMKDIILLIDARTSAEVALDAVKDDLTQFVFVKLNACRFRACWPTTAPV